MDLRRYRRSSRAGLRAVNAGIIVDHWYTVILGRRSGASERVAWIVYLQSTRDFTGAAQAFFSSPEYLAGRRTFADHATVLYRALLGRDPLPAERDALVGAILQRFTGIIAAFIGSVEFQTLVSGLGDPAAVDALIRRFYREALGRTPADSEVAGWTTYLLGTRDVTGVANGFFLSAEYQSIARSLAEHVRILYRTFLGRDSASAEQSAWIDAITARLNELIPPLVASPEFQHVPLVVNLYEILLQREPSAAELSGWVTYLGATGDIPGVLTAFFTSPEYVNRARRLTDHVGLLFRVAQSRLTLPDERAPHVAVLRSRLASVADLLIGSPEFAARLQTILPSLPSSAPRAAARTDRGARGP